MKLILPYILAFLVPLSVFCQNKSLYVEADWTKGSVYNYSVEKIKQEYHNDELLEDVSKDYLATMRVIDSTGSQYKIGWTMPSGNLSIVENILVNEMILNFLGRENVEIVYSTSAKGAFQKVENMTELTQMIGAAADEVIKAEKESQTADQMLMSELNRYGSKSIKSEDIIEQITKEIRALHYPYGNKFPIDDSVEYTEEVDNSLGGENFICSGSVSVNSVDFDLNYCIIVQEMRLEEAEAEKALKDYFSKSQLEEGVVMDKVNASNISVFEDNVFEFLFQPGVALSIEKSRAIKIDLEDSVSLTVEELYIFTMDEHEVRD